MPPVNLKWSKLEHACSVIDLTRTVLINRIYLKPAGLTNRANYPLVSGENLISSQKGTQRKPCNDDGLYNNLEQVSSLP